MTDDILRQVTPGNLRAILFALGRPSDTDEALRNSLAAAEALPLAGSARFLTARVGQPVGLPVASAKIAAVAQCPIALQAGEEKVSYGAKDFAIPPAAMKFMAERAHARKVQVVPGSSHVVMISHPHEAAGMIEQAATAAK